MLLSFINFSYSLRFPRRHSFARQHPPTAAAIKQKEPFASLRNKAPSRAHRFSSSGRFVPHLCSFRSGGRAKLRQTGVETIISSSDAPRRNICSASVVRTSRNYYNYNGEQRSPGFCISGTEKIVRSPGALLSLIKNASAADESPFQRRRENEFLFHA